MRDWLRLSLLVLSIGGGFAGFAVTWQALLANEKPVSINGALLIVFLVFYLFIIASGLLFAENLRKIGPLIISFAVQVPWISSPIISYRFTAGFHATVGIIGGSPNAGVSLGSDWHCGVLQDAPWGFGLNIFALFMLILLSRIHRTSIANRTKIESG